MINPRTAVLISMVLGAAALRLLPHYPNATPIGAMALFGGACFASRWKAVLVPLTAMFLSDLALGAIFGWSVAFHKTQVVVYGCFLITVGLGMLIGHHRRNALWVGGSAVAATVIFFLLTNLAVWASGTMYPRTFEGLLLCYEAALLFVRHDGHAYSFFLGSLVGNLFYAALLFGGLVAAEKLSPALRDKPTGDAQPA